MKASIAYYTGYNAITIGHADTITSLKNDASVNEQGKRACVFYEYAGDRADISLWSKLKIFIGKRLKPSAKTGDNKKNKKPVENLGAVYDYYYTYISELNEGQQFTFFKKD